MATGGIYVIQNMVSHRFYLGSSTNIEGRWQTHKTMLNQGRHHNYPLSCAWKKYGPDVFDVKTIDVVNAHDERRSLEQLYLDWLMPSGMLYNTNTDANGTLGSKRTTATKAMQSLSAIIVASDLQERMRRSIRARFQHAIGSLGQACWPEGMEQVISQKRHITKAFKQTIR